MTKDKINCITFEDVRKFQIRKGDLSLQRISRQIVIIKHHNRGEKCQDYIDEVF